MVTIRYRSGYKHQLEEDCEFAVPELAGFTAVIDWAELREGILRFFRGFAWNGANWLPDTPPWIIPSLPHDGVYRMIRRGALPPECREAADQIFRRLCVECGVPEIEAEREYHMLRALGGSAADPAHDEPILTVR